MCKYEFDNKTSQCNRWWVLVPQRGSRSMYGCPNSSSSISFDKRLSIRLDDCKNSWSSSSMSIPKLWHKPEVITVLFFTFAFWMIRSADILISLSDVDGTKPISVLRSILWSRMKRPILYGTIAVHMIDNNNARKGRDTTCFFIILFVPLDSYRYPYPYPCHFLISHLLASWRIAVATTNDSILLLLQPGYHHKDVY